jgi:hypothetical protein
VSSDILETLRKSAEGSKPKLAAVRLAGPAAVR